MTAFRLSPAIGLSMLGAVFASNADALDIHSTQPPKDTTGNHTFSAGACNLTVKEYFSQDNLVLINAQLAKLHEWIRLNDFFEESVLHDYLDTEEDEYGINQAVLDAHTNIIAIGGFYKAGTAEGLGYLKSDPVATIGTIYAYTGYTEMLKTMLMAMGADDQLKELKKLDKIVADLNRKADSTENLLVEQITRECPIVLTKN